MAQNPYYPSLEQGYGSPACWSQTLAAEAAALHAKSPEQNGLGYDYRSYFQQYYGGYYQNATDPNSQCQQPINHSYDQTAHVPESPLSQGSYQPGHDYSMWYQQASCSYPYSSAAHPSTYPCANPYPTYAPQPENKLSGPAPGLPNGPHPLQPARVNHRPQVLAQSSVAPKPSVSHKAHVSLTPPVPPQTSTPKPLAHSPPKMPSAAPSKTIASPAVSHTSRPEGAGSSQPSSNPKR